MWKCWAGSCLRKRERGKRFGACSSAKRALLRPGMEEKMKNRGWGTAGTLIAALLLYEIGKLAGALAARTLLPDSGEGVRSLLMHLAGGGLEIGRAHV